MSITNLLVGTSLHKTLREITICNPHIRVGAVGSNTWHCARYVSKYSSASPARSRGPKLNGAAIILEYLLTKRVAVLVGDDDRVFVELLARDGSVSATYYGNANRMQTVPGSTPDQYCNVATVMFGLLSGKMPETWDLFKSCVTEYKANGQIRQELLFEYCDSFYYEWKDTFSDLIEGEDDLNINTIKQAIRTLELRRSSDLVDLDVAIDPSIATEIFKELDEETASFTVTASSDPFSDCKNGKYIIDYCWSAEQLSRIPPLSKLDKFAPDDNFFSMVSLIKYDLNEVISRMNTGAYGVEAIGDNFFNAILLGKPGTGKTTVANALGATFGLPVHVVAVSKNSEEDTYKGMTKVSEGGFKFTTTEFLECYKNGGIILLEEFNLSHPGVMMGALGQALVAPFILMEDDERPIRRHPLCVVIATMNPETQGSIEPSEAYTSRSPHVFTLNDPAEESFIKILGFGGYKSSDCRRVYKAYRKVQDYLLGPSVNARDVAMSLTLRHCQAALKQMKVGIPFKIALRNTLIGAIAIKDLALAQITEESVIEPLPSR